MDEQRFLKLINEHQGIIYKICRLYRDSPEDREDLFQEIVYQLWKAVPSFTGEARISSWLYRVALNTAIATFRKKKPDISTEAEIPDLAEEGPDEAAESRKEQLFDALKKLDEGERAIIILYLDDLSYKEIGEITGISESHVGVKLNRIKRKLKKIMIWNSTN